MATTESELKSAFAEVGAQVKARTASGGLNKWGIMPVAIVAEGANLPTPLPAWGLVVRTAP